MPTHRRSEPRRSGGPPLLAPTLRNRPHPMPTPAFAESDLLLSQKTLEELFRARLNRGLAQPITEVIAEMAGLVRDYTGRYELPADRWRRLVRCLAVHQLLSFPGGTVPESVRQDHEAALRELEEIRDGRFADLLPPNPAASASSPRAAWGGQVRVTIHREAMA